MRVSVHAFKNELVYALWDILLRGCLSSPNDVEMDERKIPGGVVRDVVARSYGRCFAHWLRFMSTYSLPYSEGKSVASPN